jgi:pimeloyl-ACP methyl ester carboxylesterase
MGGRTVMTFALRYPDLIDKLIVVDVSPLSMTATFTEMRGTACVCISKTVSFCITSKLIVFLFPTRLPASTTGNQNLIRSSEAYELVRCTKNCE